MVVFMYSPIEFTLPDKSYEDHCWILQDEHNPASHPPLIASASPMAALAPKQDPDQPPTTININGFNYAREIPPGDVVTPLAQVSNPESIEDMTKWRKEWLPEVEKLVEMLESFDPELVAQGDWEETLKFHDQEYARVFRGIHRTSVGPGRVSATRFLDKWVEGFGEDRRADGMALLQGFPNLSLDRASALWNLGRIIKGDESLSGLQDIDQILLQIESHHFDIARGVEFKKDFDLMIERFGCTSNNGLQDLPTWREGSQIPISMINAYSNLDDTKNPVLASDIQKHQRLVLESELRSKAQENTEFMELVRLMEMAQYLLPNVEDHNLLCDQQCVASSRLRWLRIGSFMKGNGLVYEDSDVFYYRREELEEALQGGSVLSKSEIDNRRANQIEFRSILPPLYLGQKPKNTENTLNLPEEGTTVKIIKGIPTSPGSYRGNAKVFQSIDDAKYLEEGDILVVRALTPPWTPYLGLVGAVVTNSGGPLSHAAIVAREFGVPAVLGTVNGTDFIKTGAVISVDGSQGIVVIE
jgi:phosphohistidine swiveling domain-containing protein